MRVHVLGVGCAKCTKLYVEAEKAIVETGVDAELTKIEDLDEIASFGVVMTPGLVIDGEVKCVGQTPSAKKIATWLRAAKK